MTTIPAELIKVLPKGISIDDCTVTTVAELGSEYDIDTAVIGAAPAILLPGWFANDGNAEIHIPDADSGEDAAWQYVEDGEWGERTRTDWIDVWAWRRAYALDDGEVVTLALDRECHTIELPPDEPDCSEGCAHDWHERGVHGHGGGVIITEVCAHCARYRVTDTWAQRRDTGEQGLRAVEYREADEISREWAEALRLED